jgi:hypothetical protein
MQHYIYSNSNSSPEYLAAMLGSEPASPCLLCWNTTTQNDHRSTSHHRHLGSTTSIQRQRTRCSQTSFFCMTISQYIVHLEASYGFARCHMHAPSLLDSIRSSLTSASADRHHHNVSRSSHRTSTPSSGTRRVVARFGTTPPKRAAYSNPFHRSEPDS